MKWKSLFFLFFCFLMQKLVYSSIEVKKASDRYNFTCTGGKWRDLTDTVISLQYKDEDSGDYHCLNNNDDNVKNIVTVRFRTCDNCIQIDKLSLCALAVGNILATVLIGFAVYSITAQPKGKSPSSSKASDKVNLLPNGDGDTYQRLTPGQNSEYSGLMRKK